VGPLVCDASITPAPGTQCSTLPDVQVPPPAPPAPSTLPEPQDTSTLPEPQAPITLPEPQAPQAAQNPRGPGRNLSTRRLDNGLTVLAQENGRVLLSINGKGYTGTSTIGVRKPSATAVVLKAFLFASTFNGVAADVKLNGDLIPWDGTATNGFLDSFYAEVTNVVKATIDVFGGPGDLQIDVEEVTNTGGTDGQVLAVIFEDPAILVPDNSVSLLFGALDSDGDTFTVTLASALSAEDIADTDLIVDLSLGIGFGFQSSSVLDQNSTVVSGRLS
jgi:hypothetical protein